MTVFAQTLAPYGSVFVGKHTSMDLTVGKSVGGEAPSTPLGLVEKLPTIDMTIWVCLCREADNYGYDRREKCRGRSPLRSCRFVEMLPTIDMTNGKVHMHLASWF